MSGNEKQSLLICPVCKDKLVIIEKDKTFKCDNNHNFDVAKQGYVNLLTNNQKKSKLPGDSKEMVQARMEFLSKGYYKPLSDQINENVLNQLGNINSEVYNILDIGCGEGYYINELKKNMQRESIKARYIGFDISKEAVKNASSSNKEITWLVANSFNMPLKEDSFDCILSVFSPVKVEECSRVLKKDGIFIRVLPGIDHLIQIREIIYDKVILNEDIETISEAEGFSLIEKKRICFDISIGNEELLSLVKMTPHYWKTSKDKKEPLKEIDRLTVTINMWILIYRFIF